jgi:hypothetical protein
MQMKSSIQRDLMQLFTKLLQGFVLKDDARDWSIMLMHQSAVREYFSKLGLFLHLDELDGYAFLKSCPAHEEEMGSITSESEMGVRDALVIKEPKGSPLMRRMPLSFELTLLLVLLREALMQFDESSRDDHRLILTRSEIYDLLKTFYKDLFDETRLVKRFDTLISRALELQVISELKGHPDKIEVHRVIRAMVDSQKLSEIKSALQTHAKQELAD